MIIEMPVKLEYDITPGGGMSRFLRAVQDRRLVGERCPSCEKVYLPSRGACPMCGEITEGEIELPHTGTVTTFCVVNVPFAGQVVECPYVAANVLIDGADIATTFLLQEVDAADVRLGMRVEAVWVDDDELKPNLSSIRYFRPTGEPDAPFESYKEYV